mmetsp:Transcript_10539/g.31911  ORF Transcript_10539/g.31911 Transcript_10539/m.31911 type:complete len:290 (+) Transcript_10539:620-1489(+)
MACLFSTFSPSRSFVALDMASSSSATPLESSVMSSASLAMDEWSSSISARRVSTASVFSLRACALVASSVSHHPLWSASSFASSMRRTRRSLIIFRTLRKGSAAARSATAESTRLWRAPACSWRYAAALACSLLLTSARSAANELLRCSRLGKCLSALPETASLEMISMAFSMASSSSERSSWRDSKSLAFFSQVATSSSRYTLSLSREDCVSFRLPSALALACNFLAFVLTFSDLSLLACSICESMSCMSNSYAWFAFTSSFSKTLRSSENFSSSCSSMPMTPFDWNS